MSQIKVQIKRSHFFELISQANSLIEKRAVVPILSKILLSTRGDKHLCVQATDQDNSLQNEVSAQVENQGKAVIDAQSLFDILKELPEGLIELSEQNDKKIRLKQKYSVFHLLSLKPRDFPAFPPFQMKNSFFIKVAVLKHLIEKTAYCASVDETRYHLTGVFFETAKSVSLEDNKKKDSVCFRFVATDGHRLALAEYPCNEVLEKGVIISKKGVQEIKKLISHASEEEKVEVAVQSPRILLCYGSAVLSVKLVEGSYPNYRPFIPTSSSVSVEINTESFSQALRRVSLLSSNRFKGVNFEIKEKKMQMESENPDLGSARDEVACVRKKGDNLKVRFNARYVLEALSSMGTEKVLITFGGREKACVIYPILNAKEEKQQHSFCVVMPMKM